MLGFCIHPRNSSRSSLPCLACLQTVRKGEPLSGGFTALFTGLLVDLKTKHDIKCPVSRPARLHAFPARLRCCPGSIPVDDCNSCRLRASWLDCMAETASASWLFVAVYATDVWPAMACLQDGRYSVVYEVRGIVPARNKSKGERGFRGCTRMTSQPTNLAAAPCVASEPGLTSDPPVPPSNYCSQGYQHPLYRRGRWNLRLKTKDKAN